MAKKKQPARRKRGRPATGETPKRNFRMDDDSYAQIVAAANSAGLTISDFIRETMLRAAKRELKGGA